MAEALQAVAHHVLEGLLRAQVYWATVAARVGCRSSGETLWRNDFSVAEPGRAASVRDAPERELLDDRLAREAADHLAKALAQRRVVRQRRCHCRVGCSGEVEALAEEAGRGDDRAS